MNLSQKAARLIVRRAPSTPVFVVHQIAMFGIITDPIFTAKLSKEGAIFLTICSPLINIPSEDIKRMASEWLGLLLDLPTAQMKKRVEYSLGGVPPNPPPE